MFLLEMSVVGCANSSTKLQIWNQTQCDMRKLHDQCPSVTPYGLHTFPETAQDQDVRQKWIKHLNREDFVPQIDTTVGFGHIMFRCFPLNIFLKCLFYGDTDIWWPASKKRMPRAPNSQHIMYCTWSNYSQGRSGLHQCGKHFSLLTPFTLNLILPMEPNHEQYSYSNLPLLFLLNTVREVEAVLYI